MFDSYRPSRYFLNLLIQVFIISSVFASCATNKVNEAEHAEEVDVGQMNAAPRPADFILGPGDEVEVTVWREEDLYVTQKISPTGELHYPLAGDIKAAGLTIPQLREAITKGLQPFIVDPQVTVNVVTYVNQKVIVLGEVYRPGVFPVIGSMTALEAVSAAEGFTLDAAEETVVLIRGGQEKTQLALLNLQSTLESGALTQNAQLRGGDIIYVPSSPVADLSRFFERVREIVLPIVSVETGIILYPLVEDALQGKTTRAVVTPTH